MGITLKTSARMSPVSVFFILLSVGFGCLHYNGTALLVWTDAVAYCNTADQRGALVEILTAEQMEFLVVELEAFEAEGGETFWWTGGSSFGVEGDWSWPSSRETVGDFVWFDSQPVAGIGNDCLCLGYNVDYLGFDRPCGDAWHPICQIKS